MSIKERFHQYPVLEKMFCPAAHSIPHNHKKLHPLLSLVLGTDATTTSVAHYTDQCLKRVLETNVDWINSKARIILEDPDFSSASACLGEIRAYGILLNAWESTIVANSTGCDFRCLIDGIKFIIEVNTPQYSGNEHIIRHGSSSSPGRAVEVTEIIPFGLPQRDNVDNAQGEAISKLASIKKDEHQFDPNAVNILWLDFQDPALWPFGFGSEEFFPVTTFRQEISSGIVWNALYAKKYTNIYDRFSAYGARCPIYQMEYNGRLWNKGSVIDYVIANTLTDTIAFQNPSRSQHIPNRFFRHLLNLPLFKIELSWLDWPTNKLLADRINKELHRIQGYQDAFKTG